MSNADHATLLQVMQCPVLAFMLGSSSGTLMISASTVPAGGCLLGDIDRETAVYGLAVPLGHAPVTGMGLALHGGIGK